MKPERIPGENPPEKPPYHSPLTYEIRKPDELWDYLKVGTVAASRGDRGHIKIGPKIGNLGYPPMILYQNRRLNLSIEVKEKGLYHLNRYDIPNIEALFQTHVNSDLQVDGNTVYRTMPDGRLEKIAALNKGQFVYTPEATEIKTKEQFLNEIETALEMYRIYATEAYRLNGLEVPAEKVIIEVPEKPEENSINSFILSTLFDKNNLGKPYDNILDKYLDQYYKKPLKNPDIYPYEPKPTPAAIPTQPAKPTKTAKEDYKDIVKKFLGSDTDRDIETLRESITIEDRPDTIFEDIAGQPQAVDAAKALADQISDPEFFAGEGADPIRGILFEGPPGTGKTMIAKALAREANTAFVFVRASDLASKWYGDSEKLAKAVFTIARQEAANHPSGHCILFIDEVDTILPSRRRSVHEATGKVIGTFLQEIEGLQSENAITVIGATNEPDNVDPAFLSRMSERIHVPNPDKQGIAKIFEKHLQNANKKARKNLFDPNIDLAQLSAELSGISGRDIADIVQIAVRIRARKLFQAKKEGLPVNGTLISIQDLKEAVSVSGKMEEVKERERKRNERAGFRTPTSS